MKKIFILLVLATSISCGLNDLIEPDYILPENADILLPGKWLLSTLDGTDAIQDEIVKEFRTDSTYWSYSLLNNGDSISTNPIPLDSLDLYYTWRLDKENSSIRLTSFTKWESRWYVNVEGDSVQTGDSFFEWGGGNYQIKLITEDKLVLKQTVDFVGFDPIYGTGGGSTYRAVETYNKMP